jgi:hypothetical protein
MQHWQGKRKIAVVTAYVRPDGVPDFTLTEVEVTQDERENGVHYDLVEAQLGQAGHEEPLLHFDEIDAPSFLVPAVRQYLESLNCVSSQPDTTFPF